MKPPTHTIPGHLWLLFSILSLVRSEHEHSTFTQPFNPSHLLHTGTGRGDPGGTSPPQVWTPSFGPPRPNQWISPAEQQKRLRSAWISRITCLNPLKTLFMNSPQFFQAHPLPHSNDRWAKSWQSSQPDRGWAKCCFLRTSAYSNW